MPTIEKRVQALEQENATRKQAEELLTIAVRALVSKEAFEKLQETVKESEERNGKLFNVLINQGDLHNKRLTELQDNIIEIQDQTIEAKDKITEVDGKVVGLQTEMRQRFTEVNQHFTVIDQHFTAIDQRFTEQDGKITALQTDVTSLKTDVSDLKSMARQILARLPKES